MMKIYQFVFGTLGTSYIRQQLVELLPKLFEHPRDSMPVMWIVDSRPLGPEQRFLIEHVATMPDSELASIIEEAQRGHAHCIFTPVNRFMISVRVDPNEYNIQSIVLSRRHD